MNQDKQLEIIENYIDSAIYCLAHDELTCCAIDLGKIKGMFLALRKEESEDQSPPISRCC